MSASHYYGDRVVQRVNEVPSKTSPLPIITLSGQLMSQSSVTPNLSDPLICLTDEEPYCVSLPIKRSKQAEQFSNCSSSCDNLSLCSSSCGAIGGAGRLTKASSDNPIFASGSPPIPPRDYVPRALSRPTLDQKFRKPEIHPIVQDGQKRSNTHYWLLPDKQKTSSLDAVDRAEEEPSVYVNFRSNELLAKKSGIFSQFSSHKKPAAGGKEHGRRHHHASDGAVKHGGCRLDRSPEEVPLLSDISSLDSVSVDIPADDLEELPVNPPSAEERTASMGEIKEMVDKVQTKVDGVTTDESYTALALHHWNVEAAVEYLKVENLFRLGLASRERCRQILEASGWNLERAASRLVDLMSSDSSHRK